jgi:membrane protein YqaA with SNARE-associated domain
MSEPGEAPTPPSTAILASPALTRRQIAQRILAILVTLLITLTILYFAPQIQRFRAYGYPGVFLVSLLGNATILLPAPSLAIIVAMGAVLNWFLVGIVAGVGEALGELTGYLAGYGGRAVIENRRLYQRLEFYTERYGLWTIFVLSTIPNPFFDLAGIAAGVLRYPLVKFLPVTWAGKTVKSLFFAWAGSQSIGWLVDFLRIL